MGNKRPYDSIVSHISLVESFLILHPEKLWTLGLLLCVCFMCLSKSRPFEAVLAEIKVG